MANRITCIVVDCTDPDRLAGFWCAVLGWQRRADAEGQEAELVRLLELGAVRTEVGQTGEESWHVLADPEGNEFCLLASQVAPL